MNSKEQKLYIFRSARFVECKYKCKINIKEKWEKNIYQICDPNSIIYIYIPLQIFFTDLFFVI